MEEYRAVARAEGIPETCLDATIRWAFLASVAATEIAYGENSVQLCLLANGTFEFGTQEEHARLSASENEANDVMPQSAAAERE
ncbi:MAG: hypothetical protein AB7U35_11450 [Sphingobium sp.]